MKKSKLFFYIFLFASLSFSEVVLENQATNIAENFFYSKNERSFSEFNYSEIILLNHNNEDIFYVFKLNPRGFILVSADDLLMPILGYSFENEFIISSSYPTNINYLFNLYSRELTEEKVNNNQRQYIQNEWIKFSPSTPVRKGINEFIKWYKGFYEV